VSIERERHGAVLLEFPKPVDCGALMAVVQLASLAETNQKVRKPASSASQKRLF
jgi:hypothetical protein